MTAVDSPAGEARNAALYPWYKFCKSLLFWQATWFLYFQNELSAAQAILLYAVYDVATTALEVPSGYMSDRLGRRWTLVASAIAGVGGMVLFSVGDGFAALAAGQILMGASMAFASGTDSALLYESLAADGRADEIEAHELVAWRFGFVGLALSAVAGGAAALWSPVSPFVLTALAFAGAMLIALRFVEPPRARSTVAQGHEVLRLASLRASFRNPVLLWIFCLGVLMYGYSHIPFVFGQPFILEALDTSGLQSDAPLVSGLVTAVMMALSVLVSMAAPALRLRVGLGAMLLLAFGMQVALAGVLALTNSVWAIAFLFLRMVPDSLSTPFMIARMQPLLDDQSRATFLSLKSFVGRLFFAATLWGASVSASDVGLMSYAEIRVILGLYAATGCAALVALALAARRLALDRAPARA